MSNTIEIRYSSNQSIDQMTTVSKSIPDNEVCSNLVSSDPDIRPSPEFTLNQSSN